MLEPPEGRELPPALSSVAVSPSGQLCATISSDGRLRVGQLGGPGGPGVLEPLFSQQRSGLLIARFLDEKHLLLGDMRGELALLDLVSEREVYRRQLDYDPIYALAVGPERRRVAVALRSSRIQIVDAESGATLHVLEGHRDSVFDVLWLGSRQKGLSQAILEAMAAGVPVVASDTPGNRQLVLPGQTGYLFAPGDRAALARATIRLLDDAPLARRLGQVGVVKRQHRRIQRQHVSQSHVVLAL